MSSTHSTESSCSSTSVTSNGVRFVESCTLIPHCSSSSKAGINVKMKETHIRMPTWGSSSRRVASDSGLATGYDSLDTTSDGVRLMLPRFRRASSTSSKTSSAPSSPSLKPPVSPILRSSTSHVPKRQRHTSAPSSSSAETVPLRGCCKGCFAITEEAANDPCWVERFSSGAQRLRSVSQMRLRHIHQHDHGDGVLVDLNVDEVDKIRRSLESEALPSSNIPKITCSRPIVDQDEDEAELFPLPSRRRVSPPAQCLSPPAVYQPNNCGPHSAETLPDRRSPPPEVLESHPAFTRKAETSRGASLKSAPSNPFRPLPSPPNPTRRPSVSPTPSQQRISRSSSPLETLKRYTSRDRSPEKTSSSKHKRHSSLSLFRSAGIAISTT